MSHRKRNAVGYMLLAVLAAVTSVTTYTLLARAAQAKNGGQAASAAQAVADQLALKVAADRREAERLPLRRQPNVSYRTITGISDVDFNGQISLLVDVECWHGENIFPVTPEPERANRLRICVYRPDDPDRQRNPIGTWQSPAVEIRPGLYEERIPVSIPMPPNPRPYPVTVELVSAFPIHHTPFGKDEPVLAPHAFRGKAFNITVR
jgi:hypothetical protein